MLVEMSALVFKRHVLTLCRSMFTTPHRLRPRASQRLRQRSLVSPRHAVGTALTTRSLRAFAFDTARSLWAFAVIRASPAFGTARGLRAFAAARLRRAVFNHNALAVKSPRVPCPRGPPDRRRGHGPSSVAPTRSLRTPTAARLGRMLIDKHAKYDNGTASTTVDCCHIRCTYNIAFHINRN